MKPCAFTAQSLSQHIRGVVERLEKMVETGYLETVVRKLKYAGIDAEKDSLLEAMRAAAVFHDVGKAVQYYQHQFNEKCECLKTEGPSFYLHEVLSAVYFDFFLSSYGRWSSEVRNISILAVLNHMHSMRDFGRLNLFDPQGWKSPKERAILNTVHKIGSELDNLVETISEYGFNGEITRRSLSREVSSNEIYALGRKLRHFESKTHVAKLYVLFLLPVIVGDVLDATENRPGEKTTASRRAFINELRHCLGDGYGET
jgi:CRISPR-associated endonuclease Cas3-HD